MKNSKTQIKLCSSDHKELLCRFIYLLWQAVIFHAWNNTTTLVAQWCIQYTLGQIIDKQIICIRSIRMAHDKFLWYHIQWNANHKSISYVRKHTKIHHIMYAMLIRISLSKLRWNLPTKSSTQRESNQNLSHYSSQSAPLFHSQHN